MSLIPAFELGLWNAWILVIPMVVVFFFEVKVTAARESGAGESEDFQLTRKEKRIMNAIPLIMFVSFFYAVFLPLQFTITWLYSGLLIYLFGMVFTIIAVLNFATSPKGKIIIKGLYRFSRNPVYIGMLLMQIGLGMACSSWLYLLLTVVLIIPLNAVLSSEERYCLYRYGDAYREYMDRTPKWIGIPKSRKSD